VESVNQLNIEIILVDNGSTDETPRILAELIKPYAFLRSVRVAKNQGYGFGILSGLTAAKGQYLAWTHADMQTDPADVLYGLEIINKTPLATHLFIKGQRCNRPFGDVFFTWGMGIFETLLLGVWLFDINAQPTIFPKSFFDTWKNPPHDFSLDLYAYYQAKKNGLVIKRFPVNFGQRLHGISHWNINWQAKLKFIRRTISYSLSLRTQLWRK
jgi:glycosyltransferase involved in cell wall biosynthesis